jgi:cobalt-zinc-cadmium efflux system outer membrane protein
MSRTSPPRDVGCEWLECQRSRPALALAGAIVLASGCASVPRDAGFEDVSRVVQERTGQSLSWAPGAPIEPPDAERLAAALAAELDVDGTVEVALQHNRDLLAFLEELGLARAELIAARTVRNPILDGEYHFTGERFRPYEFALTQTVVDLLQLRRRRALGAADFETARLRVTASVLGFAAEVRADYYTLQAAQAALALERTIAEAAEAAAELAMRQHDAGNVTDLELETEQSRYEEAKLALARAELHEIEARERLLADLGSPRALPLRLAAQLPPAASDEGNSGGSRDETVADADLARRFDLLLAQAEVEAARRAAPLARTAAFDELSAGVHVDRESGGERSRGPVGTVPIPLFDRGLAARSRAAARLRQAEQHLHALTVTARSQARAARERLAEAGARAAYLATVVVPRRQRIVHLTQLEYSAMQRGAFDLLRARQSVSEAEREHVFAVRDYWLARTELDAATSGVAGFSVRAEPARLPMLELSGGRERSSDDTE